MNSLKQAVVISAVRTPIGRFGGLLRSVPVHDLGASVIGEAVKRAGIGPDSVGEAVIGCCRQAGNGPNPARTAAVKAGIPVSVPAYTVNMACPSALKAVESAVDSIVIGRASFVVAGGMESMSTIPHLLKGHRWEGLGLGDAALSDGWGDSVDPLLGYGMGMSAENVAEKHGINREDMDEYAHGSHRKASEATRSGAFRDEIMESHFGVTGAGVGFSLNCDECVRPGSSMGKLSSLRPVFKEGGSITAGNSSPMSDGAAALVIASREAAVKKGLRPLFSFMSFASAAVDGKYLGEGTAVAAEKALSLAGLKVSDIDLFEINEAFSAQVIANARALSIPQEKLNIFGGSIALGHPVGASGARILVTLNTALRARGKRVGLASIGGAGGVAMAAVIRVEG